LGLFWCWLAVAELGERIRRLRGETGETGESQHMLRQGKGDFGRGSIKVGLRWSSPLIGGGFSWDGYIEALRMAFESRTRIAACWNSRGYVERPTCRVRCMLRSGIVYNSLFYHSFFRPPLFYTYTRDPDLLELFTIHVYKVNCNERSPRANTRVLVLT
jgi:hypothetical protein